ncbi:MAG: N4-gp56 family major capsid protein, partial [Pseudomonadota bacterium]
THEDPVLQDANQQCGENIGRTTEALNYGVVRAGTNVLYANGSTRAEVNSAISITKQRAVVRALQRQKAMKITRILSGSEFYNTSPVEAAYFAVCHTDVSSDIRELPKFIPVAEYGSRQPLCEEEIGSCEDVRYILSPDLEPFADAGGAAGGNVVSTGGAAADVYPILFFGKEAWAHIALRGGKGSGAPVSTSIIPTSMKTKDDPLGQRGYVGWKMWWAGLITNQAWMARLEVAATQL